MQHSAVPPETRCWIIGGKVQGVGFRPYIYHLAKQHKLTGWVRNNLGQVEIRAQGNQTDLDKFAADLIPKSPKISTPNIVQLESALNESFASFEILQSESQTNVDIHVPEDYFICDECLAEMDDPDNRRYQYPFTNCTQCGPRYTLIENLPYDRKNTSMTGFPLCEDCTEEYENPLDRRFHAEPVACPVCGPELIFKNKTVTETNTSLALDACVKALKEGKIVAVKGIGGYHLICDACNDSSVMHLRKLKGRPTKPLATMFLDINRVGDYLNIDRTEKELLGSHARPIVLLKKRKNKSGLSASIAPELNEIGVMLAYSPLHHILLSKFGGPLVATSANISGEPVLIDNQQVEKRLGHISQNFLHHNRRIVRPADDSVFRQIAGRTRPIRLGRGHAPIELELPFQLQEPLLAYGSHMKNTVALAWENRLVISPHIGDLDSPRSLEVFQKSIEDLQRLYQIKANNVACDLHPAYASTRLAKRSHLELHQVQHHKAHASALVMEYWHESPNEPWLVFTWDGTGYGKDGSIWGAEAFYGSPGNWQRVASFKPFYLPGGEKAGREPWRSAVALCWQQGIEWNDIPVDAGLLKQAWKRKINSPKTTAMGRLFDAASALTGIIQNASFEGEGPMLLESKCGILEQTEALPVSLNTDGIYQADWVRLVSTMTNNNDSVEKRATDFHSTLAHTLLEQVRMIENKYAVKKVGLSGGVFQNRKLAEYVMHILEENGYQPFMPEKLPVNDAGISAGQIVEAAMQLNAKKVS